jgi:putative transcriptional regulator
MNNLKTIRERVGLTQSALADTVGLTQGAIAHYENDRRQPGLLECRKILAALNARGAKVTLDEVFPVPSVAKGASPKPQQEQQPQPEGFVERRRPGANSTKGIRTGRRSTDATVREQIIALNAARRGKRPEFPE